MSNTNDQQLMPPPMAPLRNTKQIARNKQPSTDNQNHTEEAPNPMQVSPETTLSNNQSLHSQISIEVQQQSSTTQILNEATPTPLSVDLQYKPPFWSAPPPHPLWLEVLKNGAIMEKFGIGDKGCYLIGRLPLCDLPLDHQSISRQHAVIQHRDTGESFLYDLGSTHGTSVNKRPIKSKTYFPLRIGDVIKFGLSSRLFVMGGPEEVEKEQQQQAAKRRADAVRRKMEEATNIKTYTPLIELFSKSSTGGMPIMHNDSVTWGIDMDDDAVYAHEKSEQEELFVGNEDDAEAFLKSEKKGNHAAQQRRKQMMEEDDSSSDDEFFDRTKKTLKPGVSDKVETYNSLTATKASLDEKKAMLMKKLRELKSTELIEAGEDALDAFMNFNTQSILEENEKKLRNEIAQLEKESGRITQLINIAAPALKPMVVVEKVTMPSTGAEIKTTNTAHAFSTIDDEKTKNKIKNEYLLSNEIPDEFRVTNDDEDEEDTNNRASNSTELVTKTEPSAEAHQKKTNKREKQREKKKEKEKQQQKRKKLEEYEAKYEAWVPPLNQTGDGRTTLNEKLGY